jgi:hypothetical protein
MEVGQGPIGGCSAIGKKKRIRLFTYEQTLTWCRRRAYPFILDTLTLSEKELLCCRYHFSFGCQTFSITEAIRSLQLILYTLHSSYLSSCKTTSSADNTELLGNPRQIWWYISTNIMFLDIIHRPAFNLKTKSSLYFKTQRFGDWILSPSSSGTYSAGSNR